jgi:hypothetical protein
MDNFAYLCHVKKILVMAFFNISFFKTRKPRVFNYTPRHYDPAKDELQERIRKAEREAGYVREEESDAKSYSPNIKGQFRRKINTKADVDTNDLKDTGKLKRIRRIIALVTIGVFFIMMYVLVRYMPMLFSIE